MESQSYGISNQLRILLVLINNFVLVTYILVLYKHVLEAPERNKSKESCFCLAKSTWQKMATFVAKKERKTIRKWMIRSNTRTIYVAQGYKRHMICRFSSHGK